MNAKGVPASEGDFGPDEPATTRLDRRIEEAETELATYASLNAASAQLHSSLELPRVLLHLREVLAQLVGAKEHAFYLLEEAERRLLPIASDGVPLEALRPVALGGWGTDPSPSADLIARVFLTGADFIEAGSLRGCHRDAPAAALALRLDGRPVGVAVIHTALPHKERFVPVDFALFAMLGTHAAPALVGAALYRQGGGRLPSAAAIVSEAPLLCASSPVSSVSPAVALEGALPARSPAPTRDRASR